ncbi:MAG: VOC family protein [bacterium]
MSNIVQITPLLHVPDLARALDFFSRVLRFEVRFRVSGYAYLENGEAAVRILEERGRATPVRGQVCVTVYIDVRDVDALYAELLPALSTLPEGDVHAPIDQPWNQRELQVRMPDGHWLAFGQPVRPATAGETA